MTLIEFFDKEPLENIISTLTFLPDITVFIGHDSKALKRAVKNYEQIVKERKINCNILYRTINRNSLLNAVNLLSEIAETYDDCVFDLTGGSDIILVAMGMIAERYRDKNVQLHRFNIKTGSYADLDYNGYPKIKEKPFITVRELVTLSGGHIVSTSGAFFGTDASHQSPAEKKAIREELAVLWNIVRLDPIFWNINIGKLAEMSTQGSLTRDNESGMTELFIPNKVLNNKKYETVELLFNKLLYISVFDKYILKKDGLYITYANDFVRSCCKKAGNVLEYKIYSLAAEAVDQDGNKIYDDVLMGAYIDWDGRNDTGTGNEIDVIMMHSYVPVFVSCKNGKITMDELYKLNTVADRFGGNYAKKVIIASACQKGSSYLAIKNRARDMKIRWIDDLEKIDENYLKKMIETLWN